MPVDMDSISISGKHVFVESGPVVGISGQHVVVDLAGSSGLFVDGVSGVHVFQESGAVVGISGQHVVVDIAESSGLFVEGVSGVHVFVESGVHVVADIDVTVSSGIWVDGISGVHVFQESGAVVGISGQAVMVGYCIPEQGDLVVTRLLTTCSGALFAEVHVMSGFISIDSGIIDVVVDIAGSSGLFVDGFSGVHVFQESGAVVGISGQHVVVDPIASSGLFVEGVSGVHVFIESGAHVITNLSGEGSVIMLSDLSGNIAAISKRHEGLIVMQDTKREVHKGNMYHVSVCRSGLAADADLEMLIFPASGKELHATFGVNTGGAGESCLYENIAFDTSGTPVTAHNMNRLCSGQPDTLVTIDPTNSSGGICLWCDIQGGPGGKFGGGGPGATRSDTPWILTSVSGVIPYLLRVTNTEASDAKAAQLSMTFTEEEPLCWQMG